MNARISYIDQLKGIAILLVVLGHVIGYNNCENSFLWRFIYSFHMPLFMFISGYVAQITFRIENFGWNEVSSFMIKKFRTLLLPMITWGIVIPFFFLRSTAENNLVDYLLSYIKKCGEVDYGSSLLSFFSRFYSCYID